MFNRVNAIYGVMGFLFSRRFFYYFCLWLFLLCLFLFLCFGALTWRLSRGPLDISFLDNYFTSFIGSHFDNIDIVLGGVHLARDSGESPRFLFRDVRLNDKDGSLLIGAPEATIQFDLNAFASFFFGGDLRSTEFLRLSGARLLVRRSDDGRVALGFGDFSDSLSLNASVVGSFEDFGSNISDYIGHYLSDKDFLDGVGFLHGLSVLDSSIFFFDEGSDTVWRLEDSTLIFDRFEGGTAAILTAHLLSEGDSPLRIESTFSYEKDSDFISVTLRVFDVIPSTLSDNIRMLSTLTRVDVPLSGGAVMRFDLSGRLLELEGDIHSGKGFIGFPGVLSDRLLIEDGSLRFSYDGDGIRLSSGRINTGYSWLDFDGVLRSSVGWLEDMFFDLSFLVGRHDSSSSAPSIDRLSFSGRAFSRLGRLNFEDITLGGGESLVRMGGVIEGGDSAPSIYLSGVLSDVSRGMFLSLWPPLVAPFAKDWFESHVSSSLIKRGEFSIDLPEDILSSALSGKEIPDESIHFSFSLADVVSRYYYDFPPIREASMTGHLRGRGLDIELHEGKVYGDFVDSEGRVLRGPILLTKGHLSVNRFSGPDRFLNISFSVSDNTGSIFPIIDRAPLGFLSDFGLVPERMGGDVSMSLLMRIPILPNNRLGLTSVEGSSHIESFSYSDIFRDFSISDGVLDLEISRDSLIMEGKIFVSDVVGFVDWRSDLGADSSSKGGNVFTIKADLDEAAQSRLGLSFAPIFSGPVSTRLEFSLLDRGRLSDSISSIGVQMDMSSSAMYIDALDWFRPAGSALNLNFDLIFSPENKITLRDMTIEGDDIFIFGTVILDSLGGLRALNFPTISLGDSHHLSLDGLRGENDSLFISASARTLDLRPILRGLFRRRSGSSDDDFSSVRVALHADKMVGFNDMSFYNSKIDAVYDSGFLQSLLLESRLGKEASVLLNIAPEIEGRRILNIRTDDGGSLLKSLGIYSRVSGGRLIFLADLGGMGESALLRGDLKLSDFIIKDEEMLNNLGLGINTSSGVVFDNLSLFFDVDESDIHIRTARAGGPSICVFSNGHIGKSDGSLDLAGTFIPACSLNSVLGSVPILGPLGEFLLGGKQQGLIGVTFSVGGTMDNPSFSINPLSPLAPGFMRRFFEFQPSRPASKEREFIDSEQENRSR